ncbi:MAG: hypothetical protein E7F47_01850 [Peptoniphilus harei]|nr:hypothetical protein [Peptoniphilus harei]
MKVSDVSLGPDGYAFDRDKVLILNPMKESTYRYFRHKLWKFYPIKDIEGVHTDNLTITAEAIIRSIDEVTNKTVVIINQSEVLGESLAIALITMGANVISLNSSYKSIEHLLAFTDVDVLVSASGNDDFKIDESFTRNIPVKVDLSNDLVDEGAIRSIPTVKVLKERLEKQT